MKPALRGCTKKDAGHKLSIPLLLQQGQQGVLADSGALLVFHGHIGAQAVQQGDVGNAGQVASRTVPLSQGEVTRGMWAYLVMGESR